VINKFKKIHIFDDLVWSSESTFYIYNQISKILKSKSFCNIMIPGGKSFEKIFIELIENYKIDNLNINLFMTDERFTKINSKDNNYNMIKKLSKNKNIKLFRIKTYLKDIKKEIARYSDIIHHQIDILILSVADDGHIASIFPEKIDYYKMTTNMTTISSSNHHFRRVTITPKFINEINNKIILLKGNKKVKIMKKLYNRSNKEIDDYLNLIFKSKCLISYNSYKEMISSK